MRKMSRDVSVDLFGGGGSRSAHHHWSRGSAPGGFLHDDHLLLRIARMAQAVMPFCNLSRSFFVNWTYVADGAEAIVLLT